MYGFSVVASINHTARRKTTMTQIAFLGLGNMGGPMAANLAKAGHEVTVVDR